MNAFALLCERVIGVWARDAARSMRQRVASACSLVDRLRGIRRQPDEIVELIPPRAVRGDGLETLALENLFQSVIVSSREPIALELYGAPHERRLLARATSARSLAHLCAQVRAHAPQVEVRRVAPPPDTPGQPALQHASAAFDLALSSLACDPLILRQGERLRALELRPCGGAHLPLKLYEHDELGAPGVDPLAGALAAMDGLPPGGRAVAQLALALAPDRWSRGQQRRAVEHPLAQEQARERAQLRSESATATGTVGATGLSALAPVALLALVALALYTHVLVLPLRAGAPATPHMGGLLQPSRLLGGVTTRFTSLFSSHLALFALVAFVGVAILVLILRARLLQSTIYSMRLVEERTTPIAARMRLTLYAIAPAPSATSSGPLPEENVPRTHADSDDGQSPTRRSRFARSMERGKDMFRAHLDAWILSQRLHWRANASLDQTLAQLVAAYRQHHLASGAYFVARRRWLAHPQQFAREWARRVRHSPDLLNVRELAALWHPPQGETETPLLERGRAHALLAPVTPLARGYRIGESTQANLTTPVNLPREALRHNTLLVAKTGKGKSSLLLHLALAQLTDQSEASTQAAAHAPIATIMQRSRRGHHEGLVVIDPHGDLVNNLLTLVPTARLDDVLLVDLADTAYPVALNPLDALFGRDRDKAVESLLAVLSQIWAKFWGPRMQNALEYALKTLYEANETLIARDPQHGPDQQFTLLDVAPILSAPGFRRDVLSLAQDQALRTWWTHYYQPLDFRLQLEIINPVLTKIAAFSGSRVARRIVGQSRSTLDLGAIVRAGHILLVNTAKGVVGAETSTLIGATLLGALQASLEEQGRLAPGERRQFLTIIDEFQTLLGVDYAALLSELRKFGGTFALATQALAHLDALDPTLRPTTLANVDALYTFAVSAEDARTLVRELDEAITPTDLINQDDFHCYSKLTLAGRRLPVFSLALDPPPVGDPVVAAQLRARSRLRAARPLVTVEAALAEAAARYLPRHEVSASQSNEQSSDTMSVGVLVGGPSSDGVLRAATASGASPRPAQRGRFGRRPRSGASRADQSGGSGFDLWSDLLGDPALPVPPDASIAPVPGERDEQTPAPGSASEAGEEAPS